MADFRGLEMATGYRSLGGVKAARGERRTTVVTERSVRRSTVTGLIAVTTVVLTMLLLLAVAAAVCFRTQVRLELENRALKDSVLVLASRVDAVHKELTKAKGDLNESPDRSHDALPPLRSSRMRRSTRNGDHKQRKGIRALHLQLDVEESTAEILKWKTPAAASVDTQRSKYLLNNALRLSEDRTKVTIDETGLYFVYAQIHFENARARNAFAVKVDGAFVMKCFQSLDFFNRSLTSTENSRLKPCYSASALVLRQNQVVGVANLYPHRIYNDPAANFWGIVKLAD